MQKNYILIIFLLLLSWISYKISAGFLVSFAFAGIIATSTYSLKQKIQKQVASMHNSRQTWLGKLSKKFSFIRSNKNNSNQGALSASLLTLIIVAAAIVIPTTWLSVSIIGEAQSFQNVITNTENLSQIKQIQIPILNTTLEIETILNQIKANVSQIGVYSSNFIISISTKLSQFGLQFIIFWYFLFYLIKDADRFASSIHNLTPLPLKLKNKLLPSITNSIRNIFWGNLSAATLGLITSYIGFALIGLPSKTILALSVGVLSILPSIGSLLGYLLALIVSLIALDTAATLQLLAYFLIVDQVLINSYIRGKLIDDRIQLHPALVFVAIFSGITLFGNIGLFVGPIIFLSLKHTLENLQEQ